MNTTRYHVVGIGEVLWDLLPSGASFGGAPANFAAHACQLGAEASIVSAVGEDEWGQRARDVLARHGVQLDGLFSNEHPTGTVKVELDDHGKPTYEIVEGVAWDFISWSPQIEQLAQTCDAVCFGTLGQRCEESRATIQRFLSSTREQCLRVFDINLRKPFYNDSVILESLQLANVFKLSDEELPLVAQLCGLEGTHAQQLQLLAAKFELQTIALTRGKDGSLLLRGEELDEASTPQVDVVDTIGAGDSFTAAMTWGLLAGDELASINRHASEVAAFVCTQSGAVPQLSADLVR